MIHNTVIELGQKKSRVIKCPSCGKIQGTDGTIYFVCCGKQYLIDNYLYDSGVNNENIKYNETSGIIKKTRTSNIDTGISGAKSTIPNNNERIEFTGGNPKMVDKNLPQNEPDTYTCGSCNCQVSRGVKFCPNCGKELNWEQA